MIWAFAGIVCTIGAFAYAELGTMFPESGGDFQYLSRAYGKKMALLFGWSFLTILNPIGTAGIAGVLGRYAVDMIVYFQTGTSAGIGGAGLAPPPGGPGNNGTIIGSATGGGNNSTGFVAPYAHSPYSPGSASYYADAAKPPLDHGEDSMAGLVRGFSIGAIVIMGTINILFKEGGKYASNILAIFKIAGMMMLIVIGSVQAVKNHAQSEALSIPIKESSQNVLDYVSALCFAFFAYNGFNNINLGLGELRDPERNLKRAVWIAMPFVTILFLLANFAFFAILSSYDLRHVHSLSLHAGHTVLGQPGGFLMAGTVVASALGSINANIWAGSRLLVIMAQDNTIIPSKVCQPWKRTGTQARAIMILVAQASVHALINLDFKTFSKIYSAVGWSWYGLSIAGLLYLRKKKPNFPRPVKVFWPLALGFVMVAFFLVVGSLTLAFGGTVAQKQDDSKDEENDEGGGRWMSVIIFGGAIVFMSGVIPAFYYTRWYNHKLGRPHGHVQPHKDDRDMDSDDDTEGHQQHQQQQHMDSGSRLENGLAPEMAERSFKKSANPSGCHSSASSITLVDEEKKRRRQQQQCEQRRLASASHERETDVSLSASYHQHHPPSLSPSSSSLLFSSSSDAFYSNERRNITHRQNSSCSKSDSDFDNDSGNDNDNNDTSGDGDDNGLGTSNNNGEKRDRRLLTRTQTQTRSCLPSIRTDQFALRGDNLDPNDDDDDDDDDDIRTDAIGKEEVEEDVTDFSPSGPSVTWCSSPFSATPVGSSAPSPILKCVDHPDSKHGGQGQGQGHGEGGGGGGGDGGVGGHLRLPCVISGSRSSETTLGLEGTYTEEIKDGTE
ncbi:hypothetical protein BG004_002151 [Podila humilis]|nr:hypothetical protein BG004_002151 [Podila humilis]